MIKTTKLIDRYTNNSYSNNEAPLKKIPLKKLPLGCIRPQGWLKEQLDLMLEGVTGRLYEYGKFFKIEKNGWLNDVNEGWEEVPYWLRGFYPLAVLTNNKRCLDISKKYFDAMMDSQDEDGYFGPTNLKDEVGINGQVLTDLWPSTLAISAFIHYYEYTKEGKIIDFLDKFFRYCINLDEDKFIPQNCIGNHGWGGADFGSFFPFLQYTRASDMIPHLYWFYNITKEKYILDLIKRFHDHLRGPWDEWLDHHAVNFAHRFAYDGIYSVYSKDEQGIKNTDYWYNQHMATWGQMPRGVFAADERIRPNCTDPRQGYETCGMIEFAKNFYDLGRITSEIKYGDRIEDIMLNHYSVTSTPDFKAIHYVTGSNMPKISGYFNHPFRNGKENSDKSYLAYTPYNRCCGHNTGIGWTYYADNLWQATADDGLACLLYAKSNMSAIVGKNKENVDIKVDTDYPFRDNVKFSINLKRATTFPLYLRIPKWCQSFHVIINNEKEYVTKDNETWLLIEREFNNNDTIEIKMDMEVSYTKWPKNNSITLDRGPLSYSVKIKERWETLKDIGAYNDQFVEGWDSYEVLPESPWNYGIVLNDDKQFKDIKVMNKDIKANPFTTEAPIEIKLKAKRIPNWTLEDDTAAELQASPIYSNEKEEEIIMIPLGCARLRMSCLPVVNTDIASNIWKKNLSHVKLQNRPKNRFDEMDKILPVSNDEDL